MDDLLSPHRAGQHLGLWLWINTQSINCVICYLKVSTFDKRCIQVNITSCMEVVGAWYNNILLLSIGNAARCSYLHRWLCHWYSSSMHRHSVSCHWILCKCFTFVLADPLSGWKSLVCLSWCERSYALLSVCGNLPVHSWMLLIIQCWGVPAPLFVYCQSHVGSGWFKVTKLVASLQLCSFRVWDWSSHNLLDFSWLRGPWFFLGKFLTYSFKLLYL